MLLSSFTLLACSKKTIPTKPIENDATLNNTNKLPATTTSRVSSVNAMIIIDGKGRILTPIDKLPKAENLQPDYNTIARAFTPAQQANLNLRYKTLPPKIIFVPDVYTLKSQKGTYVIYKKKFWYWKKADGLFYLDETYYK